MSSPAPKRAKNASGIDKALFAQARYQFADVRLRRTTTYVARVVNQSSVSCLLIEGA